MSEFLEEHIGFDGHVRVKLVDKDGVEKYHRVCDLIADTFLPNRPNNSLVVHKDGNKRNNNADNLIYVVKRQDVSEGTVGE